MYSSWQKYKRRKNRNRRSTSFNSIERDKENVWEGQRRVVAAAPIPRIYSLQVKENGLVVWEHYVTEMDNLGVGTTVTRTDQPLASPGHWREYWRTLAGEFFFMRLNYRVTTGSHFSYLLQICMTNSLVMEFFLTLYFASTTSWRTASWIIFRFDGPFLWKRLNSQRGCFSTCNSASCSLPNFQAIWRLEAESWREIECCRTLLEPSKFS